MPYLIQPTVMLWNLNWCFTNVSGIFNQLKEIVTFESSMVVLRQRTGFDSHWLNPHGVHFWLWCIYNLLKYPCNVDLLVQTLSLLKGKSKLFFIYSITDSLWPRPHLMVSDDAVEDGACLARNSPFTLFLKTKLVVLVNLCERHAQLHIH